MRLRVLLPFRIFVEISAVARVVAETRDGSVGFLPHRLDCVATLTPGILTYQTETGDEQYIAVDQGVLIKTGPDVLVSVRRALSGTDLGRLRDAVEQEFLALNIEDKNLRTAMAKLEVGFLRGFARLST
jgi:F-type H+-transporting ATPase subunit epsilon